MMLKVFERDVWHFSYVGPLALTRFLAVRLSFSF